MALNLLGHYDNACSVEAEAASVDDVVQRTRKVLRAFILLAPKHIMRPNVQRRELLSVCSALKLALVAGSEPPTATCSRLRTDLTYTRGRTMTGSLSRA